MFKEPQIVAKVDPTEQTPDKQQLEVSEVVARGLQTAYLFSREGKALKSKFHVRVAEQESQRMMVNSVVLGKKSIVLKMFSLFAGREVEEELSYAQLL
jgi:hypothetical protein